MNQRVLLAIALAIPILALIAVAGMKAQQRASGVEVVLPIEGFDPRDLLSGHYLTYRVDYGIPTSCGEMYETQADLCLEPTALFTPTINARTIAGCFYAGIATPIQDFRWKT